MKKRIPLILEQLEDRIFLDANPLIVADAVDESPVDLPTDTALATVDTPPTETNKGEDASEEINEADDAEVVVSTDDTETGDKTTEIVVVDSRIAEYEQLTADLADAAAEKNKNIEIIVIEDGESGIEAVRSSLASHDNSIETVRIFSYGDAGQINLGTDSLTEETLASHSPVLAGWSDGLTEDADILFYGCDVAATEQGQNLVDSIAAITGADVAASSDATGNPTSGGDWDLEYSSGEIEAQELFQEEGAPDWDGILDPSPVATVNMPAEGLIEETIDFTVSFTNSGPSGDIGYGPYMDVYVPVGLNVQSDPTYGHAGLSFQKFTWDSATSTWYDGATPGTGTILDPTIDNHPFDSVGGAITVDAGTNEGDEWYVIELPFGSFTPEQPAAVISFTAELDEDAVLGVEGVADGALYAQGDAVVGDPLTVTARAGFRFGADALDNPGADPVIVQGGAATGSVTPQLITIAKTSDAPEGQTATGPNFPVEYTIVVDIAPDQVVDNLILTDYLPDNAYYRDDYVVTGATVQAGAETPIEWQPNSAVSGDNDFVLSFGAVTGDSTDGVAEITLTYSVYYGETDAGGGDVVSADTGDDQLALNEANATGNYTHPTLGAQSITAGDTNSDDGGPGALDGDESDHQHEINSITVEKDVGFAPGGDLGAVGYTPGDTLLYTIDFEISDYFAFENVVVADQLGDGQHVFGTAGDLSSFNPTLTVFENGTSVSHSWDLSTLAGGVGDDFTLIRGADGITYISFNVSALLMRNGDANGQLLGDLFAGDSGTSSTDNTVNRPGAGTRGTITFQTIIDESYVNPAVGDVSVDSHDPITNAITISGDILSTTLDTTDGTADPNDSDGYVGNGFSEADGSNTEITIDGLATVKDMPFLNGAVYVPGDAITPGDVVTYRLIMDLPTGDLENFVLTDYLPLPVFDVAEFGANPDFDNAIAVNTPILPGSIDLTTGGMIYWGTGTTLQYADNIVFSPGEWPPQVSTNAAANSLIIDMGTFNSDSNDGPWVVEILLTVTVQNAPFADGLDLTNQAEWFYDNTFGTGTTTDEIVQIELSAPEVLITKGVVATDGNGEFDPAGLLKPGDVTFAVPGTGTSLAINGAVDAGEMFDDPIDSNMIDADGSDLVTFAISAYNVGGSAAYGLQVRDTLAGTGFLTPASTAAMNLQIWRGDGTKLVENTHYTAALVAGELQVNFDAVNGALDGDRKGDNPDAVAGDDVFIITYDLQVDNETVIDGDVVEFGSDHINTASIVYYSGELDDNGTPGDPNDDFADPTANWVDPTDPPSDDATVTIAEPTVVKELLGTSIDDGINEADEAVIGETVTYRVTVTLPEGETSSLQIVDRLDRGLALVSIDSVVLSTGLTADNTFVTPINSVGGDISYTENQAGQDILTIDFGAVWNAEADDNDPETITIEYTAVVLNTAENQSTANEGGPNLNNGARAEWVSDGATEVSATDSADTITVIEPILEVNKSVSVNGGPSELTQASGDDGDSVEYTIEIRHAADSETGAFDVSFEDIIPAEITGLAISGVTDTGTVLGAGDFMLTGNTLSLDPGSPNVTADGTIDIPYDMARVITITVTGTLASSLNVGDLIENDADIAWSSLTGTTAANSDLSGFVTNDDSERDGSGGVNDYLDTDPADILVGLNTIEKVLVNSEISTETDAPPESNLAVPNGADGANEGREATIGEELTYQLTVTMAEGVSPNVHVVDTLDSGLSLVRIDSITFNPAITGGNVFAFPIDDAGDSAHVSYVGNTLDIFLGDLENTDNVNANIETIVITYTVMVTDLPANAGNGTAAGTQLDNSALVTWEDGVGASVSSDPDSAAFVEVVEPDIEVVKDVSILTGDAGDAVSYTITIQHTADSESDAFDVSLSDLLPTQLSGLSASVTTLTGGLVLVDSDLEITAGGVLQFAPGGPNTAADGTVDIGFGQAVTITVSGTLRSDVQAGELIPNTADIAWSSMDGDRVDHSGFVVPGVEDRERDYTDSDDAELTIATPSFDKALTDPTDTDATIGETVSYDLIVTVPEGTTNNIVLHDDMPAGMSFLSASVVTLATNSVHLNNDFAGNGITIQNTTTTGLNDAAVSIELGNIVAAGDNNVGSNQFVIRILALVLDVAGNDGLLPGQTTLTNDATMEYDASDGSTITEATEADLADDPVTDTTITVVEPSLQIVKDVDILGNNYGIAGDAMTYTLVINHTAESDNDAHDVTIDDILPPEFVVTGFTAISSVTGSVAGSFQLSGQNFTTLTPLTVVQGEVLTITFTGTISNTVTSASFVDNVADLEWSTVAEANEVDSPYINEGTDGTDSDREYTDFDDAEFSVPDFEKVIVATSLVDTDSGAHNVTNEDLTIGEIVTYRLTATLPNGASVPTIISDNMPSNLEILSATVFSIGSDISGSGLAVGASGTIAGAGVTFNFGTVTVADDDVVNEDGNRIVIEIQAVVRNDLANNNDGDTKTNSGSFDFDGSATLTDSVTIDTVEPDPGITKTFYDGANSSEVTVVDAGDRVTIRLQVTNSGTAPLFDASVADTLDAFFDSSTAMVVGAPTHGFVFAQNGADISFTGGTLQAGQSATLTFSVVVSQAVNPNTAVVNTATLTGDTLPNTHTGNDDHVNYDRPYTEIANDNLLTPNMSIVKAFVVSDNPDTPDVPADGTPDLNIGEIATFHFRVTLPEGTMPSLEFIDQLPSGMQYVDGTARLILDTAALGETSPLGAVQFAGSVTGTGGAAINNGDFFLVPDVDGVAGDGNDVQIDFGQVVASGQQGDADRQFIIELQAVVINVSTNQSGTELVNTATIDVPGDGTDPVGSNPEVVEVVDPVLDIEKRFYDSAGINEVEVVPGGNTVTVSLTLINSGTGPSYDLEVEDPLDPTKFNIATIAAAITPAGYTFSVSGNTVTYSGDGAIMPGERVTFTYTVQVIDGFRQADNTATVTAGDTVPGESVHERDHDGAQDTDTIYEFVEPTPSVVPPVNPVGPENPSDVGLMYMAGQGAIDHGEIFPIPEPEETFMPPPVPVTPVYTGRAEPGTTMTISLFDVMGNRVGYRTVMADTGGNWLASFTGTLLYDMPHRMEIMQTTSLYNQSTPGLFNLRSHFNPTMVGLISSSLQMDIPSITAYEAGEVMESLHSANYESMSLGWDQFAGYEFFVSSTNPSQNKR